MDRLDEILAEMEATNDALLRDRVEAPPEGMTEPILTINVRFGVPVYVTAGQYRRLSEIIDEIVRERYNQPLNGVHWVAGEGAPPNLHEGFTDTSRHQVSCIAREFVSDKERAKVKLERAKVDDCPVCSLPRFRSPGGPVCENGHGG